MPMSVSAAFRLCNDEKRATHSSKLSEASVDGDNPDNILSKTAKFGKHLFG